MSKVANKSEVLKIKFDLFFTFPVGFAFVRTDHAFLLMKQNAPTVYVSLSARVYCTYLCVCVSVWLQLAAATSADMDTGQVNLSSASILSEVKL